MGETTLLLNRLGYDQSLASEKLLPLVYDELRQLAAARMARESPDHTLQPTALVHEAWLRLAQGGDQTWNDRTHFFRAAALAMRRILVDHARLKSTLRRGADAIRLELADLDLTSATRDDRVVLIDEALDRLEQQDPESARLVTLKFFGGFTNLEIAGALGVTERTVERQWAYARACLLRLVQANP